MNKNIFLLAIPMFVSVCIGLLFAILFVSPSNYTLPEKLGKVSSIEVNLIIDIPPTPFYEPYYLNNNNVIETNKSTKGNFFVCGIDSVNAYGAPQIMERVTGVFQEGDIVNIREIRNGYWALIAVNPTIQYLDMNNLCRIEK